MAQLGRGNVILILAIIVSLILVDFEMSQAAPTTYQVGGKGGWTFNVANWPKGKRFRAGDVLFFKYNPLFGHSVYVVNKVGYAGCITTLKGAKGFRTGKDSIKLVRGNNYFICGFRSHCLAAGMKLVITAF